MTENSTPNTPQNLTASGNGTITVEDSQVTVTWDEVQNNTGTVTGDPDSIGGNTIFRDPKGYKLYRGTTNPFTLNENPLPSPGTLVVDASSLGFGGSEFVVLRQILPVSSPRTVAGTGLSSTGMPMP